MKRVYRIQTKGIPLSPLSLLVGFVGFVAMAVGLVVMALFVGTLVAAGGLVLAAGSGIYYAIRRRLGKPVPGDPPLSAGAHPLPERRAPTPALPKARVTDRDTVIDVEVIERGRHRP